MERLWNANYCKVMAANFSLFFAFYVLTPLLPLYMSEHFGATKDVIGMVLSGYTITALVMRPFSGYLVDSFPRKLVLMVSFTAFAIFFAGYLAASTLLLFTIVRTLHGAPFGALTVANSTVAIDVRWPLHRLSASSSIATPTVSSCCSGLPYSLRLPGWRLMLQLRCRSRCLPVVRRPCRSTASS